MLASCTYSKFESKYLTTQRTLLDVADKARVIVYSVVILLSFWSMLMTGDGFEVLSRYSSLVVFSRVVLVHFFFRWLQVANEQLRELHVEPCPMPHSSSWHHIFSLWLCSSQNACEDMQWGHYHLFMKIFGCISQHSV